MKKTLFTILLLGTMIFALTGCGESDYEKASRSGFEKFTNGDFDDMTDLEREAVNDFLEWSNDH